MVKRICPQCGKEWYSADEGNAWCCVDCGGYIGVELNESAEREKAALTSD
jgi:tRNA(Ile2) C34 agmatinyltransferase TiaS